MTDIIVKCNHLVNNPLELHYMVTDSIIVPFSPIEGLIEDLKHFKKGLDFNDLGQSH